VPKRVKIAQEFTITFSGCLLGQFEAKSCFGGFMKALILVLSVCFSSVVWAQVAESTCEKRMQEEVALRFIDDFGVLKGDEVTTETGYFYEPGTSVAAVYFIEATVIINGPYDGSKTSVYKVTVDSNTSHCQSTDIELVADYDIAD
jgi:hypothetical protein